MSKALKTAITLKGGVPTLPHSESSGQLACQELWVSGAGGVGCTVNGLYTHVDSLNGRPKYEQERQGTGTLGMSSLEPCSPAI